MGGMLLVAAVVGIASLRGLRAERSRTKQSKNEIASLPQFVSLREPNRNWGGRNDGLTSFPLQVAFETSSASQKDAPVILVVEGDPSRWPAPLQTEAELTLLLNLPASFKLKSEGWKPVETPTGEAEDPAGPWSRYERRQTLLLRSSDRQQIARLPISLALTEEGTNWVLTVKAEIRRGEESITGFGTLFATFQEGTVEFHQKPKRPIAALEKHA